MTKIPIMRPELPPLERYVELLRRVWDARMLSNFGPLAREFEHQARGYLGNPHLLATGNADLGLVLGLAALALPEGAEAIVPSFTFNSTVNAVLWNRLTPVFADIDPATLTIDPAEVERLITPRTAVIIGTHVFGNPCDADALLARAQRQAIPVVYDAAHSYGSRYRGRPSGGGTLGTIEVFSFSGTKLVTSAEGGLVAPNSAALAEKLAYLRAYGFQGDYESHYVGLNGKISELNAALGVLTLELVERAVLRRAAIVARYRAALAAAPGLGFQQIDPRDRSTHKDFAILCRSEAQRNHIEQALTVSEIQTKRYFRPAHTMRAYRRWSQRALPATDDVYARILCLPIFNDLPDEDVDRIAGIASGAAR